MPQIPSYDASCVHLQAVKPAYASSSKDKQTAGQQAAVCRAGKLCVNPWRAMLLQSCGDKMHHMIDSSRHISTQAIRSHNTWLLAYRTDASDKKADV